MFFSNYSLYFLSSSWLFIIYDRLRVLCCSLFLIFYAKYSLFSFYLIPLFIIYYSASTPDVGRTEFELFEKPTSANYFQIEREKSYDYFSITYIRKLRFQSKRESVDTSLDAHERIMFNRAQFFKDLQSEKFTDQRYKSKKHKNGSSFLGHLCGPCRETATPF